MARKQPRTIARDDRVHAELRDAPGPLTAREPTVAVAKANVLEVYVDYRGVRRRRPINPLYAGES